MPRGAARRRPTAARRACERRSGGNASSTSASEDGHEQRGAERLQHAEGDERAGDGAIAHSAEASVNSASPPMNTRRRPSRSANRPPATGTPRTRCCRRSGPTTGPRSSRSGYERAMSGNAMLTIVASTNAIEDAQRRDRQHRPRLRAATPLGGWGRCRGPRRLGMHCGHRAGRVSRSRPSKANPAGTTLVATSTGSGAAGGLRRPRCGGRGRGTPRLRCGSRRSCCRSVATGCARGRGRGRRSGRRRTPTGARARRRG